MKRAGAECKPPSKVLWQFRTCVDRRSSAPARTWSVSRCVSTSWRVVGRMHTPHAAATAATEERFAFVRHYPSRIARDNGSGLRPLGLHRRGESHRHPNESGAQPDIFTASEAASACDGTCRKSDCVAIPAPSHQPWLGLSIASLNDFHEKLPSRLVSRHTGVNDEIRSSFRPCSGGRVYSRVCTGARATQITLRQRDWLG